MEIKNMMKTIKKIIKFCIKALGISIKVLEISIMVMVAVAGYGRFIEPYLLQVKSFEYDKVLDEVDEVKVIQFSDVHLGKYYSIDQLDRLVEKINTLQPDVIVFTGDLIDTAYNYEEIEAVAPSLKRLQAKLGKVAIRGNHDYGGGAHRYYQDIMQEAGFVVLENQSYILETESKKRLCISGIDDVLLGEPKVKETFDQCKEAEFHLALLHEADYAKELIDYSVDLILAGHSHGGQIDIPFIGPIVTTSLGETYVEGFYTLTLDNPNGLYVNTGIGTTKIPIRINNLPEITVFYLSL